MPDQLQAIWQHWYPSQRPAAPAGPATPSGQGVLPGAPPFNYDPSFGGIPGVPSPTTSAANAIGGNIGNLGNLYQLGAPLNTFTAQQAQQPFNLNLPQYQGMLGTSSTDILSKLQGQIPQDVRNQLTQFGAERGVQTGSIGSPNANAALMSLFGTNSLALQNLGEQQFTAAIGRTPTGQQFNPFGFLVSPQEQQAAQYQANLLNAAPVPSSAQYANLNALQAGRGAGYGGFPTSAPPQQAPTGYTGPRGLPPMGYTPYGTPTGSYSLTQTGGPFQPSDFESMGFYDEQSPNTFQPGDFESMGFYDEQSGNPLLPGDFEAMFGEG